MTALLIRNVEVGRRPGLDVRVSGGRVAEIGVGLRSDAQVVDGRGGALIGGLHDHHIHLFGLAAQAASIDVTECRSTEAFEARIRTGPVGSEGWRRVIGFHEALFGPLNRERLDRLSPDAPARVQHQTGALWVLNSAALARLEVGDDPPSLNRATGELWRGDAWLREQLGPPPPPPLAPVGRLLARLGITGLTDATPTTDDGAVDLLAGAHRRGDLPQRLRLMSAGPLNAPADQAVSVGEVKVLLDDHALIEFDDFANRIAEARDWGRRVAVHCVTATELALTLAAFEFAGARSGDRIEHGGTIPAAAIPQIRRLGLTVVTQPGFVSARGDRYLAEMAMDDLPDAWRLASLINAGVTVAAGSDAPYGPPDPWAAILAATQRRTASGADFGPVERIFAARALALFQSDLDHPGGTARSIVAGAAADLVLLSDPLDVVLANPRSACVRSTIIAGRVAWSAENH